MSLYWGWPYVLVEAGPEQALTWRTGHMRGDGPLPDLFFPADRSWLVSALWDDTWTDIGGSAAVIAALHRNPLVNARPVGPDEDALPAGTDARLTSAQRWSRGPSDNATLHNVHYRIALVHRLRARAAQPVLSE